MAQEDFLSNIKSMWSKLFAKPDTNVTPVTGAAMPIFDTPITADDAGLQKILQQKLPTLLYLYNKPDSNLDTTLNTVAKEHAGKLQIAKLNVDDNPNIARRYDVMSIPTLLVFDDGEVKKRLVGAKGKAQLLEELSEFIA